MNRDTSLPDKDKKRLPDPQDYLSNERTYLSWIRTSIGLMVFGFVVVKFTMFVKEMSIILDKQLPQNDYATTIGISIVALGVVVTLLSFLQYKRIGSQLGKLDFQPSISLTTVLSASIILIGILLVAYLIFTL